MTSQHRQTVMPLWSWGVPFLACGLLAAATGGVLPAVSAIVAGLAALLLLGSVFAAVHHAETVALRVGEPFGSILLAIAVTVIEVALIISIMLSGKPGAEFIARDTVFAAVMIVLNGVVGLCLLSGGARHHEQSFQVQGATAALSVLGTLAVITLVLPNYTLTLKGPYYAPAQLVFIGFVSLVLYGVFVFIQAVRHRDDFITQENTPPTHGEAPSAKAALLAAGVLVIALASVILLAKILSSWLEHIVAAAGLPSAFVGVVIAGVVLLPEGLAALAAARANQIQTSLNLALGSALASIGLTIPAVAAVAVVMNQKLAMGLGASEIVLLVLTLFISTVTLATGRTNLLQGAVHLVIFGVYLFLSAVP